MKYDIKSIAAVLLAAAWIPHPMPAVAQSYTIDKPGELPVHVRATQGGATISKPGELPVHVRPTSGGFIVQKAGELPTYVRRSGGGKDGLTAADVAKYLPGIADKAENKQGKK